MSETIDIRYILNSDEFTAESKKVDKAIAGSQNAVEVATEDMRENIAIQKQVLKELENQYRELQKVVKNTAPGAAQVEMQRQLSAAKIEIDAERKALAELSKAQTTHEQSTVSLRTQIMNMRNSMATMVEGTKEYSAAMLKLGELQDKMGDIQQQGRIYADDEKYFRTATESVQGLAGAMSVAVGVGALFGASQENLAKIQAKLQAVMAISIGVQQVAQVLNKDSYVSQILLAKAKTAVATATMRMSVALGISTAAAKALMATLTLGLSVAITGVIWAINKMNKENEETEKRIQAAKEEQKQYATSVANSAASQIISYKKLQSNWNSLGNDLKQKSHFIKNNQSEFTKLGVAVTNVADAEKVLVSQSQAVVGALMARANAQAAMELATKQYQEAIKIDASATGMTPYDRGLDEYQKRIGREVHGSEMTPILTKEIEDIGLAIINGEANVVRAAGDKYFSIAMQNSDKAKKFMTDAGIGESGGGGSIAAAGKDYSDQVIDAMLKLEQSKIDVLQNGRAKELAQIELTRNEKLAAIDKERADLEQKLKTQGKTLTPAQTASFDTRKANTTTIANSDVVDVNKKYDEQIVEHWKATTAVFATEEQKRTASIKERYDKERQWADKMFAGNPLLQTVFKIQIDAAQAHEELQTLTANYQTYADKRTEIEQKYNADIAALIKAGKSEQAKIAKQQMDSDLSALDFQKAKKGVDLSKLFGNLDNMALPSMEVLRDKIRAWIDSAGQSLSPEDFKIVSDAFQKLDFKIADKSPFKEFATASEEYKTATQEAATAQAVLNTLQTQGVTSGKQYEAAQKALTDTQNKQATAIAKQQQALSSAVDKGQQVLGAAKDVMGILGDLGVKVPEEVAGAMDGIGQMLDGLGSIDLTSPLSVVTGAVKMLGGLVKSITSLFGGSKKTMEELARRQKQAAEQNYFAELEINDLYRQRYEWAQKIGESTLNYIKRQGEELAKQAGSNSKEQDELMAKLLGTKYKSGEHFEKTGLFGWGKGKIVDDYSSLAGKSWQEIEVLASSGKLSAEGMKYYEALKKAREQGDDLATRQEEYLEKTKELTTGSTYQGVVDGIVDGFKAGKRSAADFAQTFDDLMQGAVVSALNLLADEKMRKWYDDFAAMGTDGYTDDEIAQAKADYLKYIEQLGKDAAALEQATGIKIGDTVKNDNSLTGQIKGSIATESSVAELKGLFRGQNDKLASIDGKIDIGFSHLIEIARTNALIEAHTRATAANTAQTVQTLVTGFGAMQGELTAINKNTSKDNGSYGS